MKYHVWQNLTNVNQSSLGFHYKITMHEKLILLSFVGAFKGFCIVGNFQVYCTTEKPDKMGSWSVISLTTDFNPSGSSLTHNAKKNSPSIAPELVALFQMINVLKEKMIYIFFH